MQSKPFLLCRYKEKTDSGALTLWGCPMTAGLQPYPAYKLSGVAWLGEVPAHWEVAAVKRHYSIKLGKMLQNAPQRPDDAEVPYLKAQHVQWFQVLTAEVPKMWASQSEALQFGIEAGDLLVCEGGEGGRCAILNEPIDNCIIQNALHRVRPREQSLNIFLQYVMSTVAATGWFDALNDKATIAHFTKEKFDALRIPLPPLTEQRAIVCYLDHVDRRIQRYVEIKEKLIALLQEARQSIIQRAVTRGLDPEVPLKPSSVDWLGDVPAHWEVRRAKYLYHEVNERSSTGAEELMSVSHKTGVTPRKKNVTMFRSETNAGYKLCRPGDIVINTMWAYMAALGVARQVGLVSPSYNVYRPIDGEEMNLDYIDPLLRTETYRTEYLVRSTGITVSRLRLYPESFLDVPLLYPPVEEQTAIAAYLDRTTADIDAAIDNARRQVEFMAEYRASLIAHVVTGKLDVRAAAERIDVAT